MKNLLIYIPIVFLIASSCNKKEESGYSAKKGAFRQSVTESGELKALNSITLSMPKINYIYGYNFKIIGLAEHGKIVHKGDPVIIIDQSSVQKYIIEKKESLETEIASTNKLQAQIRNNLQELLAQIKNDQASFDIKKLEKQNSAFESEGMRKVIDLEFRQAEITLKKLQNTLERRPLQDSLDLRIQKIKVAQKANELNAAQSTLDLLTVRTPFEGIFVVADNWRTGKPIKVGDEVYLGNPVAQIPDIRTMSVDGYILENDISRIRVGQNVIVRLDAMPSVQFHGKLSDIAKVCIDRDQKKVFLTQVLISESDTRLKPGMTVSCEYIIYEGQNDLYVPNNCIVEENKHLYVFVKKRGKIRKTEIKPGPSNNTYTIVSGDLKPGQSLELPENIIM
jgi:HlyD family secretion protein